MGNGAYIQQIIHYAVMPYIIQTYMNIQYHSFAVQVYNYDTLEDSTNLLEIDKFLHFFVFLN